MTALRAALTLAAYASAAFAQLDQFVQFDDAIIIQASYRNLSANATQCGLSCLQDSSCVSFNIRGEACELNGYGVTYAELKSPGDSYYHRIKPRNDQPAKQAIPFVVSVGRLEELTFDDMKPPVATYVNHLHCRFQLATSLLPQALSFVERSMPTSSTCFSTRQMTFCISSASASMSPTHLGNAGAGMPTSAAASVRTFVSTSFFRLVLVSGSPCLAYRFACA